MDILILVRGGSKGIPRKNIKELNGKPLLAYVIEEAKKLPYPIYVSTEDPEIKQVALDLGVQVIDRPPKLAQDDSKSIDAVKHAQRILKSDYVVLLNACTPFVKSEDIQACIDLALEKKADSVTSLVEDFSAHPSKVCHCIDGKILPISNSYSFETGERQKQTKIFKRNTAIYISSKNTIRKGYFFGQKNYGYVMPIERSLDLNTLWDWTLAKLILKDETKTT